MAPVQVTIPFKSRKRTCLRTKIETDENKDILNTVESSQERVLKRHMKHSSAETNENEKCSAVKIARINTSEINKEEKQWKNSVCTKPLTSREKEIEFLETFLMDHLERGQSASLYVSGQPGTGKTASLNYILQLPKVQEGYKHVYVNCTMMKSAAGIYRRICQELHLPTGAAEKACRGAIENYLRKKHKMILLVLDEIDQLDSKRQSVLYTIFEWPARADSRLVLVGVANALDLAARGLPRLQARCSLRPNTLHFPPYTKQQIINIFTTVLQEEDKSNLFSPVALQMLAAKIAAVSGDMRRALDAARAAARAGGGAAARAGGAAAARAGGRGGAVALPHVLRVLDDVYGGSTNIQQHVEHELPMHQKLILCSLMLMLTKGKNKDILMGKLYDVYKKVAAGRNIAPLELSEAAGACALLEARGALRVWGAGGAGGARRLRLRLQWDEAELGAALRDKPLLSAILNDVSCLS